MAGHIPFFFFDENATMKAVTHSFPFSFLKKTKGKRRRRRILFIKRKKIF